MSDNLSIDETITHSTQSSRIGDYVYFTPAIGRGSYSKVFRGYHIKELNSKNEKSYVAIKRISITHMKKISMARIQREIDLLKRLNHPNIVRFHEAFTDIAQNIYIITELCNYGDLSRFTKTTTLDHDEIKNYMSQLRDGLHYLLQNNILHRDLKPQNILLHRDLVNNHIIIKIADFGFAKAFESLTDDSMMETLCGTPMYLSPEVVKTRKYTIPSDLWSVGIILYQLFYHTTPFDRPRNILELIRSLDTMCLKFPSEPQVDLAAKDLMKTLLQLDPQKRSSWGNFFSHSWFPVLSSAEDSLISESINVVQSIVSESSINDFENITSNILNKKAEKYQAINNYNKELDDSGISTQVKRLLNPPQPIPDDLELYGHSSKLFEIPKLVEDHFPYSISSSMPTDRRINERFGQPLINLIGAGSSISPLTLPNSQFQHDLDGFNLDDQKYNIKTNYSSYEYDKNFNDIKTQVRGSITSSPNSIPWTHRTRSWFGNSNSWTHSGESVARVIGDAMNSSVNYLSTSLLPLLDRFGADKK